jgi:Tol biopolymer transport system component
MSTVFRLGFLLGVVAIGVLSVSALVVAGESTDDLIPVLPLTRPLFRSDGHPQHMFRGEDFSGSQSISADGKWLLMTNGGNLMLCDLSARPPKQPRILETGSAGLDNSLCILSPDGKTVAAAGVQSGYSGGGDMSIHFFDTVSGKHIREIDNDQPLLGLAFSPDGRFLAVGTQQRIELWKADDGEEVRLFSGSANGNYRLLTFSPDGKMLAALGSEANTVHIWETASGKERASISCGTHQALHIGGMERIGRGMRGAFFMRAAAAGVVMGEDMNFGGTLALAFSPDSRLLAVSEQDSAIHLWDLQTNRELPPLTGFRGQVSALAFSPDGKELMAVDTEGMGRTWRMTALRRNRNIRLAPLDDADFAELWDDLTQQDAFRLYRARRHLVSDPKRSVPLLSRHLTPVPVGDTARIQRLIKDLSSPNAGKRRKAMTELRTKHGEAALGALMQMNGGGNGGLALGALLVGAAAPGGDNQAAMLLLQKLQTKYHTPEHQRAVLAAHILGEIGTPEARQTLAKLAKGAAGAELTTAAKAALDRLSAAGKQARPAAPEQSWADLGSGDAKQAFQAMCRLAAAPEQSAALLRKELKPAPIIEEKEIAALLDKLSSDDFQVREQATEELTKIGERALPAMKKALAGGVALEARKRLERVVEQVAAQSSAPLLRILRAIEVLEHMDRAESRDILHALSGGAPESAVTREAKASLQRLARR